MFGLRRSNCVSKAKNFLPFIYPKTQQSIQQWRLLSATARRPLINTSLFTENQVVVREAIQKLCADFPDTYWREMERKETYPYDFYNAIAQNGWIGIALPEELGGAGMGISEATAMMHTISESGGGIAAAQSIHANVYATQPLAKFGTEAQKAELLPRIIQGKGRICFGVTEPNTGSATLKLKTVAEKDGDSYLVSGQKIWITSAQQASHMILLARTTPLDLVRKPSEGLSLFAIPFDRSSPGLELRKIKKMGGQAMDANEVFFDRYRIPASSLIGRENHGFKIVLHGMNAERCLLAGEALGLGYVALQKATTYAKERIVFERPIGQNQSIQHPLADAWMNLEAAKMATYNAAALYDRSTVDDKISHEEVGAACNMAKYLAAEAAYKACERAVLTHGGMGYSAEFDVERYLREIFVPRIAPVSREMILNYISERVLKLPRSY